MHHKAMLALGHHGDHVCAPKEWRHTANVTGDYDMDATIAHRNNRDLPHRLELYTRKSGKTYGYKTGYSGSHGMHGDD